MCFDELKVDQLGLGPYYNLTPGDKCDRSEYPEYYNAIYFGESSKRYQLRHQLSPFSSTGEKLYHTSGYSFIGGSIDAIGLVIRLPDNRIYGLRKIAIGSKHFNNCGIYDKDNQSLITQELKEENGKFTLYTKMASHGCSFKLSELNDQYYATMPWD